MSSWRSSSGKSLLDPDAMLDLEDQLDYEPDGEEDIEDEDEVETFTSPNIIQKSSLPVSNKEGKPDNKRKNSDPSSEPDYEALVPEPSGQEDQESDRASSSRQSNYGTDLEKVSFNYGTDLEKASSVTTLSFRDKITYMDMHLDVEKDSFRSKYGRYSIANNSYFLDSSSDEEEFDVAAAPVRGDIISSETPSRSQLKLTAEEISNLEDRLLDQDAQQDEGSLEYEYYPSSESNEYLEAPNAVGIVSPNTVRVDENATNVAPPIKNQTSLTKNVLLPQKKTRTDLNFSIKVIGTTRTVSNNNSSNERTVIKTKPKPWLGRVGKYIDDCDVVKLTSADPVIRFTPEKQISGLGTCSDKSSFTSDSNASRFSLFKVPLNRPPTRQKGNGKIIAVSVDLQTQWREFGDIPLQSFSPINDQEDKDDIISLMASSCHLGIDELEDRDLQRHNIFVKDEPSSLPESSTKTEKAKLQRTAQWVTTANQPYRTPNQCTHVVCTNSHELENHSIKKELRFLTLEGLKEAYEYAKEHSNLYGHVYAEFADVFAEKGLKYGYGGSVLQTDLKGELISMVNIIFEESSHKINLEEGLNTVLTALQKTYLTTFEDTVEFLLLQIGLNRYPTLGHVLMEIICKKPDLIHHWPIVRRLIIAGQKLNIKLGNKFLVHLMKSPVNKTLCQEVYHHILKHRFIDFPRISDAIRTPFLNICAKERIERNTAEIEKNVERNLMKERFNFERTIQNRSPFSNNSLSQDFSIPPPSPTLGFARALAPTGLNYMPPTPFGGALASQQSDFASLSRQKTTFAPSAFNVPPPTFDSPTRPRNDEGERRSQSSDYFHDIDFRFRPPPEVRSRRYSTNESSEEEQSPIRARYSESGSSIDPEQSSVYIHPALLGAKKRPAPARLYNKEGLHYDPANDYTPPLKKQAAAPLTDFDRLKERGPVHRPHRNNHGTQPAVFGLINGDHGVRPALNRPNRTEQGAGPAALDKPTHNNQGVVGAAYHDGHNQGVGPALNRPKRTEQGTGPTLVRPNHNDHHDQYNQGMGPALNRPKRTEQGTGPTLVRTNHNDHHDQYNQGMGPALNRPKRTEQGTGPTLVRPNHNDHHDQYNQGMGPALNRPKRTEQGTGPTLVRPIHNDHHDQYNQGMGPALNRPKRTEQGTGPTLVRPNHNDHHDRYNQGMGSALNRPNRTEHGAGPTLDGPNHNDYDDLYNQGVGTAPYPQQNHSEQGTGPEYLRLNQEEHGAEPAFNLTDNDVQGARPATRKIRSTNTRAAAMVRRLDISKNEAAVSSSSDAKLPDEKPPEHPRFGNLYFDPNYEFNVSLHNSYLQAIDNVDIDEDDVLLLNNCVKQSDGRTFLNLVEQYKGPKTVQNFISMTLAHLKGMNQMVARTYQRLLDEIEKEDPGWYKNIFIRVILEVITMNLLFELFQRNMVLEANNLLKKFSHWDSLVTSRLFINGGDKAVSIIGRYLFLAKILSRCKPELTYEILVCPALHLLEKYEIWPYHPPCPIPEIFNADLGVRNAVIEEFLKKGYLLNTVAVIQLYKTAFKKPIWQFDVKRFVDPMVIDLIIKGQIISLKQINNEINIFCKHMDKDTLRAFLISMCPHISQQDMFKLYEKCVERKVYQRLVKEDNLQYTIEVKTNMKVCEIELIIEYFFSKLTEIKKVPSGSDNLRFEIKLPGETTSKRLPILLADNKSLVQINEIVRSLLRKLYGIDSTSCVSSVIEVQKEALVNYLEQRWL